MAVVRTLKKRCSENGVDDTGRELEVKSVIGARRAYYDDRGNVPCVYVCYRCVCDAGVYIN